MKTTPIILTDRDAARFYAKASLPNENGCMLWLGAPGHMGYGHIRMLFSTGNGNPILAHRIAYTLANGPIPDGMLIDHICHVRLCVAPAHLRLADKSTNGQNRAGSQYNTISGVRGVGWSSRDRVWIASAELRGERHYLGRYSTVEEAASVVTAWRREHMPYSVLDQQVSA